jgi:starch synthase
MEQKSLDVLYVASEVAPFSKAGGVASVAGELPPELKRQGVNIEILAPYYGPVDEKHNLRKIEGDYEIEFNGRKEQVQLYEGELDGVRVTFIKNETYFGTKHIHINSEIPFETDSIRFSFLSQACLSVVKSKQPKIVHVNDWQFGYLLGLMKMDNVNAKRVTTIHNLNYQGNIWRPMADKISSVMKTLMNYPSTSGLFQDPRLEWDSVNPFRLSLELSDMVNAVSPTYAKEILQSEDPSRYFEGGKGLEGVARRLHDEGKVIGILNGYYYSEEPNEKKFREMIIKKRDAKEKMSFAFKRPTDLLFGLVGRAVEQKLGLLKEEVDGKPVLEHLLEIPEINFAFLGTGEKEYETFLHKYHNGVNCSAIIDFDGGRANTINLGSDVCLVPSMHEPCGIVPIEAGARATPSLIRFTGGLIDLVISYPLRGANGFGFEGDSKEKILRAFITSVAEARRLYYENPKNFLQVKMNAFKTRFTWGDSAGRYIGEIYEPLLKKEDCEK